MSFTRLPPARAPEPMSGVMRLTSERRFGPHRSNVAAGLVSALTERFPVVQRLVGEEFFRAMARAYVVQEPPRSPVLRHYGATFPTFVDGFEPAASIGYLADVARLEFARGRAHHAADAASVSDDDVAAIPAADLAGMRVALHPSMSVIPSRHPIVSIWEAHRDPDAIVPVQSWIAETALVSRPFLAVDVRRLPAGGGSFLTALARGLTIAEAAKAGSGAAAPFDMAENLAVLFGARIVTGVGSERVPLPTSPSGQDRLPQKSRNDVRGFAGAGDEKQVAVVDGDQT